MLEEFGVRREVEEDEVVGELEVAALAADLGADEQACSVGLGEVGGVAVALEQGEALVEDGGGDFDGFLEIVHEADRDIGRGADEKDFLFFEALEEIDEPRKAVGVGRKRGEVGFAFRKAGEGGAGVAEHHAAGAEFVEQAGDDLRAGGFVAGEECVVVGTNSALKQRGLRDFFSGEKGVDGLGDGFVALGLAEEFVEVAVALGVEQAEAGEVSLEAELLRGGGEEEQPGNGSGKGFDEGIFGGGFGRGPAEMVGFIDDEQVPTRLTGLIGALGIRGEEVEGADHELAVEKGIRAGGVEREAALLVENTEGHLEPAEHFHEPLVEQRGRKENEDARGATGEVQALEDETGLDGFSKAHLVGEKDARSQTGSHFRGDGELVGNEVDAAAGETAGGILAEVAAALEALGAQAEALNVICLAREEALLGF